MAQDRTNQTSIQRELVRAAIFKLRQSGLEISPHSVALEAKMPRSTIYRNAELMDLINKEGGVNIESESPFQPSAAERIAELEARVQELDQSIWDLEKENEDLQSEVENAWTMGFQAGLAEASRRQEEPETEPLTAEHALSKVTGEHALFRITGSHAALKREVPADAEDESELKFEVDSDVTIDTPKTSKLPTFDVVSEASTKSKSHAAGESSADIEITGDHQAYTPAQSIAEESIFHIDDDSEVDIKVSQQGRSKDGPSRPAQPTQDNMPAQQPTPEKITAPQNFQPTESSDSISPLKPASVPASATTSAALNRVVHPLANRAISDSDIFNATRSGPYPSNNFNPLVELSWKDLETVYNFRVESLMDYSRNIPSGSKPVDPPALNERSNGGSKPIMSDYIDPEILGMLPSDDEIASLQNLEGRVYSDNEISIKTSRVAPDLAAQIHREQSMNEAHDTTLGVEPPAWQPAAPKPLAPEMSPLMAKEIALEIAQAEQSADVAADYARNYQSQQATGDFVETPVHQQITDDRAIQRNHPDETVDRLEAIPDPRQLDSEDVVDLDSNIVDLDSLDIFDDIDDYNIETLTGHAKKAAEESAAGVSTAGDELRELIKGRIQSADNLPPHEPVPQRAPQNPTASATNLNALPEAGEAAANTGSRSKFIGGKGGGTSPDMKKPSFVVKQIPPEIRKNCHILGLRPEELTRADVISHWKTLIASPGVHPDLGGDTESAVFLNIAKDTLIRWLDDQAPKLGKKFGQH